MIQKKKCKGHGKAKNFEGCGKEVDTRTRTYGLCQSCRNVWAVSTKAGEEYLKKRVIPKAKKTVEKKKRRKRKEEKESLTDYAAKLQETVNKIIRLIDIGLPCLAREYHPDQMHAGHIYSRGAEKSMRFNVHNIHRQSAESNWKQNDDWLLRKNLIHEYGQEYFDFLTGLRRMDVLKYTNAEYKEFHKKALEIARRLKRSGERYDWRGRIRMRNQVNKELGIYPEEFCTFEP